MEKLYGKCVLSIRVENHGEYLKFKKYNGGVSQWDFIVSYPAILRAEYEFHTILDVEVMAKRIVQLLQLGFNVHSAHWQLKDYQSQVE